MKVSRLGIDLIAQFEGCRLTAYPDASKRRIPTIGFGHTGAGVMLGQRITQERANELLASDLVTFEAAVTGAVRVPLTQCQFNALVSLTYNIGTRALSESKLLRKLNAGDYRSASLEFLNWTHAGAEVLPGLVRRRVAERAMFGAVGSPGELPLSCTLRDSEPPFSAA